MQQAEIAPSIFGTCPHELKTVNMSDTGENVKSLCDVTGTEIWTNCRKWGRCTLAGDALWQ